MPVRRTGHTPLLARAGSAPRGRQRGDKDTVRSTSSFKVRSHEKTSFECKILPHQHVSRPLMWTPRSARLPLFVASDPVTRQMWARVTSGGISTTQRQGPDDKPTFHNPFPLQHQAIHSIIKLFKIQMELIFNCVTNVFLLQQAGNALSCRGGS